MYTGQVVRKHMSSPLRMIMDMLLPFYQTTFNLQTSCLWLLTLFWYEGFCFSIYIPDLSAALDP